jgi:hypothetical protein
MSAFTLSQSARINAGARRVYDIIADYRDGHQHIVPPKYFTKLDVEMGGTGEGTVIRVTMRVLGSEQTFRAKVTEPEPGRVIAETDLATGLVTTFTVVPEGDRASHVTITTRVPDRPGFRGVVERWLSKSLLPRIYRDELQLLARHAEKQAA